MNRNLKNLCLAAMFVAIGLLLPFIAAQIPELGKRLSPMHIPVMLCGLICGWKYGLAVGFITPLLRSLLFQMPTLIPDAVGMAFELATYGTVVALIYGLFKEKNLVAIYCSLIPSMLIGRLVWGIARTVLMGVAGAEFSFEIFITSGFVNAIPAIILQLVFVPMIMEALWRARMIKRRAD